ncbi:MAG TPA: DUF3226 domain-containing protein [Pirellulales bacterium]|nr:DUF3226 domain-containing protein [Pirellulales bacterium]
MSDGGVLLVEGRDDQHVIWALLKVHKVPEVFKVEQAGSVEELLSSVPVRLKGSDRRLAVVLDANQSLQTRWDALRDRLRTAGFHGVPKDLSAFGTVVDFPRRRRLGVWLMPDNRLPGILEDFLTFLVPREDTMLPRVDAFLSMIPAVERRFPESRRPKARIHTWLAVQEEPGKPLGQSITARYLDAEAQVVGPFLNWLRAVLVD